ncbi:MAG: hypothetical protein IJD19_04330 [Ruminococcus sp.]|nr:hypothetical protein [Ruminococcus sp.]
MSNKDFPNEMLRNLSKNLGQSPEQIVNNAQSGNIQGLLSNLSEEQKNKVNDLLTNPEKSKKFLENPQIQALIRKLSSNG